MAFEVTNEIPRGQAVLADQLKRAAISVPLNIAEERVIEQGSIALDFLTSPEAALWSAHSY